MTPMSSHALLAFMLLALPNIPITKMAVIILAGSIIYMKIMKILRRRSAHPERWDTIFVRTNNFLFMWVFLAFFMSAGAHSLSWVVHAFFLHKTGYLIGGSIVVYMIYGAPALAFMFAISKMVEADYGKDFVKRATAMIEAERSVANAQVPPDQPGQGG